MNGLPFGSVRDYVRAHYRHGWRLRRRVVQSFAVANGWRVDGDIDDMLVAHECGCGACVMLVDEWRVANSVA